MAIAGITVHPNEAWMKQIARNATMDEYGALLGCGYLGAARSTPSFGNVPMPRHQFTVYAATVRAT